jgi:dTDP-4-amino-4,6-dideoxygalactose transaminase
MERISAFARERGLWVVEDNAHGLYSTNEQGQPLGTLGDIGVLSFTKALAMPDGGALIVKDGAPHERAAPPRGVAPAPLRVAGRMKSLLEGALVRRYPTATRAIKKRAADPLIAWIKTLESGNPSGPDTTEVRERRLFEFDPERARWRMSGLARRLLLRSMPPDGVISARRQNFMTLLRNFKGGDRVVPLLDALPRGCCPLFFPVLMKTGNDLRAFLTAHGVESHRFGFVHEAIPGEQFPFEDTLKRDVLGLPVHQGLGETDMLYVAHLLEKWESGRIERKVSR